MGILLGLESVVEVAAGATVLIHASPCTRMKPDRLMISPSLAPFFTVVGLVIARTEYAIDGGAAPAEVFVWNSCDACGAENSCGGVEIDFHGLVLEPGMCVTVTVTNIDNASHPFRGALECWVEDVWDGARKRRSRERVVAEARLQVTVEMAVEKLRSGRVQWPDTAHEVAAELEKALKRLS